MADRQGFQQAVERAALRTAPTGESSLTHAHDQQRIVALFWGSPPEGRGGWTVRLLSEQVVKDKLAPRVGGETSRVVVESHDLEPWRGRNVVLGGTR